MDILAPLGEPFPEAIYTNPSAVKAALTDHARVNGYGIKVDSSTARRVIYQCAKGGKYDDKGKDLEVHESKR